MKAILFDMDGTLLPMDEDEFIKGYFKLLAKKLCPLGLEPEKLIDAVWYGTKCMYKNDGSMTNEEVFWKSFSEKTGMDHTPFYEASMDFYPNEFHEARAFTKENKCAREAVKTAREKADKVILATNPLFPMTGQRARMSWMGLCENDFDMVTSYENSFFTKPNTRYFEKICEEAGVLPKDCIMIGNNEDEDMFPAQKLGMETFLVEDYVKKSKTGNYSGRRGSFSDMMNFLKNL